MHLVIDAVGAKHSGAATVLLDFLKAAVADERLSKITVFCAPQAQRNFSLSWSDNLVAVEKPIVERSRIARLVWYVGGLGRAARGQDADIVLCMSGQGCAIPPTPHVTFIQQSLPFSREACSRLSWQGQMTILLTRIFMRQSCRKAQRVVVQTPTMAEWVSTAFQLAAEKLAVVMPTSSLEISRDSRASQLEAMRSEPTNSRLLYVGNGVGYKMIGTIVEGLQIIRQDSSRVTLFLTLEPTKRYAGIPGVICLGYLPRDALYEAYALCTALVMPSLVETVGLPMIEAMSLGKPVLAADRPYAHDVCADAAMFFDPSSPHDFADKVKLVMQNADLQKKMINSGLDLTQMRARSDPYRMFTDVIMSTRVDP